MAARGFTLIEMMVVVVVLTIVAAIAFVGIGQNTWESDYLGFTDDLEGAVQRARNAAIDDQTEVWIDFRDESYRAFWIDPDPASSDYGTEVELFGEDLARYRGGRLRVGGDVCIRGFAKGVSAPSQAEANPVPVGCVTGGAHTLRFLPSGEMRIEVPGEPANERDWGGTLYVADNRIAGAPRFTTIEIFPGGMIRKRENVR